MESSCDTSKSRILRWDSTFVVHYYEAPTRRDIKRAWFSQSEYASFRKQNVIFSRLANEIGNDDMEKYCKESSRGIEHSCKGDLYELRRTRRDLSYDIIIGDPEAASDGVEEASKGVNWERTSRMYQIVSQQALKDAQLMAQNDAEVAAIIHHEGTHECMYLSKTSTYSRVLISSKAKEFPNPCIKKPHAIPIPRRGCIF